MENVIQIHFYANMRTMTGLAHLEVPLASARTLRALLDRLIELFPGLHPNLLDQHGDLRHDVPIFVNGRNPRLTRAGTGMLLKPDDIISLFSPISSGRMNVEVMREPAAVEKGKMG